MSFQCVKKYEDSYDKYVLVAISKKVVLPDYLDKESKKLAEKREAKKAEKERVKKVEVKANSIAELIEKMKAIDWDKLPETEKE